MSLEYVMFYVKDRYRIVDVIGYFLVRYRIVDFIGYYLDDWLKQLIEIRKYSDSYQGMGGRE